MLAKKKQAWASWVNTEYYKCKNARSTFDRQWHLNLAFYSGKQYVSPINAPGHGFRLVAPKAPPWRVRMVINKIRTAVRTESSKLISSSPMPVVIPATTEDEDYSAARVAEQILRSEFNRDEFKSTFRSFVWWGVITGNSYLKSYWNPAEIDPMAQPAPQMHPIFGMIQPPPIRGKICIERVSPFHVFVPDLLEEDIELQPYVIHVSTKSPLWVERNFGFKPTPDSKPTSTILEAAVLQPAGAANDQVDSVLVKEVWLKPYAHPDFPEGGVLTVINDRVVQHQERWPWPFKEYPFYKYSGIPTGGFYTESVVTDLIPVQKEYNRTKSQMIEIKNLMGKPKLMAPRGSVDPRKISSEPGQAILYTPGFDKPTILPAVEVPVSMSNELDRLNADFDDISGQHEITRGNTPSQVTSGTAISFLQEQDDSKLSYQVAGIEHAISKLGTHFLKYAASFWNEQRLVRIVGRDGDFEAKHWRGSDLRGNTDVRVQSGSALPYSKAARQALVMELIQNQLIDPQAGLEVMELGGLDKIMEDLMTDKRAAQRENMKMSEMPAQEVQQLIEPPIDPETGRPFMAEIEGPDGRTQEIPAYPPQSPDEPPMPFKPTLPIPVNSWDNHQAHIHYHNQYRKTQQFELLDDSIKKMFELHVQAHQMALMVPQMSQSGLMLSPGMAPVGDPSMMGGASGGEGEAPSPEGTEDTQQPQF